MVDAMTTIQVPESVMTAVEVEEPKEVHREITEQVAVVKVQDRAIRVPITTVERLPAPPCHWHSFSHSHGVQEGKVHTHTEDHDHCDTVEESCQPIKQEGASAVAANAIDEGAEDF